MSLQPLIIWSNRFIFLNEYDMGLQRYRDYKIKVCGKNQFLFILYDIAQY